MQEVSTKFQEVPSYAKACGIFALQRHSGQAHFYLAFTEPALSD
jgi:hypothetical protein